MRFQLIAACAAVALSTPALAGGATIADRCMTHVSNGAITTFRDVDVLASGRARIAYFRCVRTGLRDDTGGAAFAGLAPSVTAVIGGSGSGFGALNFSL